MRATDCLNCQNPEPDSGEPVMMVKLAESTSDRIHHHHRIICVNCGAWWFDDVRAEGSPFARGGLLHLELRDTSHCECPDDEPYYQRSVVTVPAPEGDCACTKEFIESLPTIRLV